MKTKKTLSVLLALATIFLSGCFNSSKEYTPPDEIARQQSQAIIEHIENKNSEGLKAMFCEKLKSRDNIDNEIEELFDFIDGEIVSYDTPYGSVQSKSATPKGTEELGLDGDISNIKTSTGKIYVVTFYSYLINKEDEDSVGITTVSIFDEDTYDPEEGYPDYGKYSIVRD